MADPSYPLFSMFAFLGFLVTLIPLSWHLEAWNSGTCYYMAWASLACLNQFVNSVVWAGNALNPAPVWCDICMLYTALSSVPRSPKIYVATRIMLGSAVGIPAASLCINRRLYQISSSNTVTITLSEVRPFCHIFGKC
jgi:pheromone a factor receptor